MRSRDKLFHHRMVSLWENWALLVWKVDKNLLMVWGMFWPFSGSEGSPEGPWGSPMVPNGQSSVPWEVEMNYSTMGLFHYGRTGCFTNKRESKIYLMIWCIFWPFSGSEGPPEGPWGSPMVLHGQPSVPWEVKMNYSTMGLFHYGRTGRFINKRWSKKYLMHILAVFRLWRAPQGSLWVRVPNDSHWTV